MKQANDVAHFTSDATHIVFYANYNTKDKRYFISGKNEKGKFFSLWKNPNFDENEGMYINTNLFKGGYPIAKANLKLLPTEDGSESKVLVFNDPAIEKTFLITKEEIAQRKEQAKKKSTDVDLIADLLKELCEVNKLKIGKLLEKIIAENNNVPDECTAIDNDDDLPF